MDARSNVHVSASTWTSSQPVPDEVSAARDAVLAHVVRRIVAAGDGRVLVAIDGRTAAGKTTFAHELAVRIADAGRPALRACLDDFKQPWRDRHRYDRESGEGYYRNAFDHRSLIELLLLPAGPGGSGRCVLCKLDPLTQIDHSSDVTQAADDAVLIVDGVFACRPEIDAHWDVRIWLEVAPEVSIRRGAIRDRSWAGEEAERIHRERYRPAEDLYIAEVDPLARVDLVIDNSRFDHPIVLMERPFRPG